jgi:hypothetical protein
VTTLDAVKTRKRNRSFRSNSPLRRSDREETPFAGHALEFVSAALLELQP